jgi:hypothetical protein
MIGAGNGQHLLDRVWAILQENKEVTEKFPNNAYTCWANVSIGCVSWRIWEMSPSANRRQGRMLRDWSSKLGNFHPFSLKCYVLFFLYQKLKEQKKILKSRSSSSPMFALSSHSSCSQTQNGAAVPLKVHLHENFLFFFFALIKHIQAK